MRERGTTSEWCAALLELLVNIFQLTLMGRNVGCVRFLCAIVHLCELDVGKEVLGELRFGQH